MKKLILALSLFTLIGCSSDGTTTDEPQLSNVPSTTEPFELKILSSTTHNATWSGGATTIPDYPVDDNTILTVKNVSGMKHYFFDGVDKGVILSGITLEPHVITIHFYGGHDENGQWVNHHAWIDITH